LDADWAKLHPVTPGEDAPKAELLARADAFDAQVEAWTHQHSIEEVLASLIPTGIPAGAVREPADGIARTPAPKLGASTLTISKGPVS